MAECTDLQKVGDGHSNAPNRRVETPKEKVVIPEPEKTVHAYIVFEPETTIEEGIQIIEQRVLGGTELFVSRKDTSGNAVVALITSEQQKQIAELPEVISVEEEQKAGLHSAQTEKTEQDNELYSTEIEETEQDSELRIAGLDEMETLKTDISLENSIRKSLDNTGTRNTIIVVALVIWCASRQVDN